MATLGAGVSSLIPALRTVTQTTTVNTQGLYQLANAAVGDTLKVGNNGNFWGAASTAVGKLIGSIPLVREGHVDEFFQDSGKSIKENAYDIEKSTIAAFAEINNPETRVFIDRMEEMIQIYNNTEKICFDDNNIYLIAG